MQNKIRCDCYSHHRASLPGAEHPQEQPCRATPSKLQVTGDKHLVLKEPVPGDEAS